MRSYYDELGVSPNASPEEIRETYRNLVRLLHPDQQLDGQVKEVAEHQMKRINYIHQVLSDPEKRRRYDAESSAVERPAAIIFHAPMPPPPPQSYRGTVAWVVAALICGALISWLINRESFSSVPEYAESAAGSHEPTADKTVTAAAPDAKPVSSMDYSGAQRQIATLRGELRESDEERAALLRELNKLRADPKVKHKAGSSGSGVEANTRSEEPVAATFLPPPPAPSTAAAPATDLNPERPAGTPVVTARHEETPVHHFGGVWFYARPRLQHPKKAFYPPEYIEANIVEENGAVHGRYRARYQVTDRAISPDVNFEFEGKATGSSANLAWNGAGGSKGEVQIKLISETSLEVVWSATQLGRTLGLAAGSAVLVRRADP